MFEQFFECTKYIYTIFDVAHYDTIPGFVRLRCGIVSHAVERIHTKLVWKMREEEEGGGRGGWNSQFSMFLFSIASTIVVSCHKLHIVDRFQHKFAGQPPT